MVLTLFYFLFHFNLTLTFQFYKLTSRKSCRYTWNVERMENGILLFSHTRLVISYSIILFVWVLYWLSRSFFREKCSFHEQMMMFQLRVYIHAYMPMYYLHYYRKRIRLIWRERREFRLKRELMIVPELVKCFCIWSAARLKFGMQVKMSVLINMGFVCRLKLVVNTFEDTLKVSGRTFI